MPMRAGREDGYGHIYDAKCKPMLYQEEYVVTQQKGFVQCDCPEAPLPITEGDLYLTNWRLVALGPMAQDFAIDTVTFASHAGARIRPDLSHPVCDYLEIYLDEVLEAKKSLLGDVKLYVRRGTVDLSGTTKEFKSELLKAVEWYQRSRR
jgi:hypothetical protein